MLLLTNGGAWSSLPRPCVCVWPAASGCACRGAPGPPALLLLRADGAAKLLTKGLRVTGRRPDARGLLSVSRLCSAIPLRGATPSPGAAGQALGATGAGVVVVPKGGGPARAADGVLVRLPHRPDTQRSLPVLASAAPAAAAVSCRPCSARVPAERCCCCCGSGRRVLAGIAPGALLCKSARTFRAGVTACPLHAGGCVLGGERAAPAHSGALPRALQGWSFLGERFCPHAAIRLQRRGTAGGEQVHGTMASTSRRTSAAHWRPLARP